MKMYTYIDSTDLLGWQEMPAKLLIEQFPGLILHSERSLSVPKHSTVSPGLLVYKVCPLKAMAPIINITSTLTLNLFSTQLRNVCTYMYKLIGNIHMYKSRVGKLG